MNAPLDNADRQRGMTLVEILAVVVILGILAATLAVSFSGSVGKAKQELARTAVAQAAEKLELYRMEKSQWPSNDVGLKALSDGYASPADPFYLPSDKLLDPWNRPLWFVTPGPGELPYEIVSYGADGQPGGEGENRDVSSAKLREEAR